jgi:hypothetical protein
MIMAVTILQAGGLIQANAIYRVAIQLRNNGKLIEFTSAFFVPTGGFVAGNTLGNLAFTVQSAIDGSLQAITSIETDLVGTQVNQLQPHVVGSTPLAGIAATTSIGSVANPTWPRVAGLVVTKLSLTNGRTGRGRMYLPPSGVTDMDDFGKPTAGYLTRATTMVNDLFGISAITGGSGVSNLISVIYNRKSGGFTAWISSRVNPILGTQRRRGYYKVARHRKAAT